MREAELKTLTFFLLVLLGMQTCYVAAQSSAAASNPLSLRQFFESIENDSRLASWEEYDQLKDRIAGTSAGEIAAALPAILTTLENQNRTARHLAAAALLAISMRPDSASLLRPHISRIIGVLHTAGDLQPGLLMVISLMKPTPPPEAFPPLLEFANRVSGNPETQAGALSILLLYRPDDPQVAQAVEDFASRPLDASTRSSILSSIRLSSTTDARIEKVVLQSLGDRNPGVKISAVKALARLGKGSLMKAEPALRKMAENPDEHPEVKAAAAKALKSLEGETH